MEHQEVAPEEIDFNALMRDPMALRTLHPRFIPAVQEKLAAVLVALSHVMEAHAFRQGTTDTPARLTRDNDRMLTLKEAADILSVSTSWVRDHVPCVKRLGTGDRAPVRVSEFELRSWIRQQHSARRSSW
jgi:hypothetical protein